VPVFPELSLRGVSDRHAELAAGFAIYTGECESMESIATLTSPCGSAELAMTLEVNNLEFGRQGPDADLVNCKLLTADFRLPTLGPL
jgi:hypothetical protein